MVPSSEIAQRIKSAVEELPYEKQQEVYDFAKYLKNKVKRLAPRNASLTDLVGILEGPEDLSNNHDEIYD
jgi:hypothetical protein